MVFGTEINANLDMVLGCKGGGGVKAKLQVKTSVTMSPLIDFFNKHANCKQIIRQRDV